MGWAIYHMAKEREKHERKYNDIVLFKRIIGFFKHYVADTISVILLVITASIFATLIPIIMQKGIDYFIIPGEIENNVKILIVAGIYLIFIIINFALVLTRSILFAKLGQRIIYKIRNDVFTKLQYVSFDYFTREESGKTISKVTNDVDSLGELLTSGIIDIFADFFTLGWIVGIMFSYNVPMTLLVFTVIPILLLSAYLFQRRVREAYRKTRVTIAKITANLQESIEGVKVTKALSREDRNIKNFVSINQENLQANVQAAGISSLFMPVVRMIAALGSAIILIYGSYASIYLGTVTYGELYLFLQYSSMFFAPIISLFLFYTTIQSGFAAAERIFGVLDEQPSILNAPDAIIPEKIEGHIKFENVSFHYREGVPVLKNINIEIMPGESVALVGHTGAGKSTITKLLSRYYDVSSGRLLIDGIDIRKIDLATLRKNIALVPQDVFLFSGTIMENLKYGKKDASDEEVWQICKQLGIHDFIINLPEGYMTEVQEGGSRLSVGQRQLISLARAIIANPKILILDECTSSVDPISESLIQKGIDYLLEGRTSIIIAHRLSTIKTADKIVVFENGEIIERGTHAELLNKKGKYYSLYETQLTSNIIEN
ncbi:MAG: ABC transporter ATP-binding protein [Candidatus Heimdallarchaeaceae archaeon]